MEGKLRWQIFVNGRGFTRINADRCKRGLLFCKLLDSLEGEAAEFGDHENPAGLFALFSIDSVFVVKKLTFSAATVQA